MKRTDAVSFSVAWAKDPRLRTAMEAPLVSIYDKPPGSRARYAWWRFIERHLPMLVIYLLVATLVGVILAPFMLVTVPSGYVGVLWKRFGGGTVLNPSLLKNEGMRIILPWNKVFLYDLRLQSATETYNAISRDGISLIASINTRYRLKRELFPSCTNRSVRITSKHLWSPKLAIGRGKSWQNTLPRIFTQRNARKFRPKSARLRKPCWASI